MSGDAISKKKRHENRIISEHKLRTVSPNIEVFHISKPEALQREIQKDQQTRSDENTIIYGENDDLPLRILQAVEESPTTTSCLDVVTDFVAGAGFTDPGLETVVLNKDGLTLLELNRQLAEYLVKLEGFSANFKYSQGGKIAAVYPTAFETVRFIRNVDRKSKEIHKFKVNPYYGTNLYSVNDSQSYCEFNIKNVLNEYQAAGNKYKGQLYYFGYQRALYKFYPVPKYWTGQKWIYVDANIQKFHAKNLDNGFFQSVLMKMIGDPNEPSNNPDNFYNKTLEDGSIVREHNGATVGQDFNTTMAAKFSGASKAGTALVLWTASKETSAEIEAFPTNTNFDVLSGTFTDAIRGITIATKVPAILANLPQQANSLGSDGNAFQKAIELMQSRTIQDRKTLENFYNNILLPNLETPVTQKVKIKEYKPVNTAVTIEDKFWEVLSTEEKRKYVQDNVPGISMNIPVVLPTTDTVNGIVSPEEIKTNDAIKNLTGKQMQNVQRIVRKFNKNELTYDQAAQLLKAGFNFSDNDVSVWLVTAEEE